MTTLNPTEAANIASTVENVLTQDKLKSHLALSNPFALKDKFEFLEESVTRGVSGPTFTSKQHRESGFGYVAKGKGAFAGDVLIAFRGTKIAHDVWTDFAFAQQKGPSGFDVHGGFNTTFNSLKSQVDEELSALFPIGNPTQVHIVGHSLGGAITTLAADWCLTRKTGAPHLYTFGCPRVGTEAFANSLTARIKASSGSVNRVYHSSDVVPMVPMFPFLHLPMPGIGSGISRHGWLGVPVSISAHVMVEYTRSVDGRTWEALSNQAMLQYQNSVSKKMLGEVSSLGVGRLSAAVLSAINSGISALMEKSGVELCATAVGQMTMLDRMSWALCRLAQTGKECLTEVSRVLQLAVGFLGMQAMKFGKLSFEVIRAVFYKLFTTLYNLARMAIEGAARLAA